MFTASAACCAGASASARASRMASRSSSSPASGPRLIPKLAPDPVEKFVDVGPAAIIQSRRISAFIESHRQQPVGRDEAGQFPRSSEQSLDLLPPSLRACTQKFFVAPSHQRTAQHSRRRDLIQGIHHRGQQRH